LTVGCALLLVPAVAQVPATDPVLLAKYDTNRNGRLDPAEIAAMPAADRPAAAATMAPTASDEIVALSPFEVMSRSSPIARGSLPTRWAPVSN
jgi:hypothetical protein